MSPRFLSLLLTAIGLFSFSTAHAAVLVDDSEPSNVTRMPYESGPSKSYVDGLALRKEHPWSAGGAVGGPLGLVGVSGEYNLTPEMSIVAGLGGGVGFQSFAVEVKKVFGGTFVMPYVAGGYSRWFSSSRGTVDETTPEILKNAFLTEKEKQTGNFGADLIFPSAGIQYVELTGPAVGLSIYAEVTALISLERLTLAPTGALGTTYAF